MTPRIMPAIIVLLKDEKFYGTTHDIAERVFACLKTVERYTKKLHDEGKVRICMWQKHYHKHIPVWKWMDGHPSLPKPKPLSVNEQKRAYRAANPLFCERQSEMKRRKRLQARSPGGVTEWAAAMRMAKAQRQPRRSAKSSGSGL